MKKILLLMFFLACFSGLQAQQALTAQFPLAVIAGKSSGEISIAEIKAATELTTTHSQLRVIGFAVRVGATKIYSATGSPVFTDAQLKLIAASSKGSTLFIEDIETLNPQDKQIRLQDLAFILK
jgi:hypothetical protein